MKSAEQDRRNLTLQILIFFISGELIKDLTLQKITITTNNKIFLELESEFEISPDVINHFTEYAIKLKEKDSNKIISIKISSTNN